MATPKAAPELEEVVALAERALGRLEGDGQVGVLWERLIDDGDLADTFVVTFTAVQDGRAARVGTASLDDEHLARAAKGAVLRARRQRSWPAPPLPEPASGRGHHGFDPALLDPGVEEALRAARPAAGEDVDVRWRAGVARTAVASTTGVRAAEERSHVVARVRGRRSGGREAAVTAVGTGIAAVDVAQAAAEVRTRLAGGPASERMPDLTAGTFPFVLGPEAVAAVLDRMRAAVGVDAALGAGPLAGPQGRRIAAPGIHLSDDAHHPATLARTFDAEGVPRIPVVLIDSGIARGPVHDSGSAAQAGDNAGSTGHATQAATLAPFPDHLVLAGGDAADVAGLCEPVGRGLYIAALERDADVHYTVGAALIEDGRIAAAIAPAVVTVDALEVLASVEALTAGQRLVPLRGHCPGGIGAAVVPALRAVAGIAATSARP